jgi:hypothetical protein
MPRKYGIKLPQTDYFGLVMVDKQEITRLPIRSALFKQRTDGSVVRWVTTSEYPLLNVFLNGF